MVRAAGAALALAVLAAGTASGAAAQAPTAVPVSSPGGGFPIQARSMRGLPADVATLILHGREGGTLETAALAMPWVKPDGQVTTVLQVEVAGASLFGSDPPRTLAVELYAYAIAPKGAVRAHLSQVFLLDLDRFGDDLVNRGIKFIDQWHLPPGEYQVRVLVREGSSQRFGLRHLELTIPAAGVRATLLPALFADTKDGWLLVRGAADGAGSAAAFLKSVDGGLPAALPVLPPGQEVTARLSAYGLAPGKLRTSARFLDQEGQPVGEVSLRVIERGQGPGGFDRLRVQFGVPAVPPGTYTMETRLAGGRQSLTSRQIVWVRASVPQRQGQVWSQVSPVAAGGLRQGESLPMSAGGEEAEAIADAYRQVLSVLASGLWEEAVAELHRVETRLVAEEEQNSLALLGRGEMEVVHRLAATRPESLIPLFVLHLDLLQRYIAERRYTLARHAGSTITTLASIYAEESASELAPVLAAKALASVGAFLRSARLDASGRAMLERAVELDTRNTFALLNLAVSLESYGRYDETIAYLERLVALEPESAEGRLRLAVCLRRTGRSSEAARQFRHLVNSSTPEWVLAISYQELARIYLKRERAESAVRLLEEGVRRLPGLGRLRIQLAYALDRSGESDRAQLVMGTTEGRRVASGSSPRFVYNRRLGADPLNERHALLQGGVTHLPALAQALDDIQAGSRADKS